MLLLCKEILTQASGFFSLVGCDGTGEVMRDSTNAEQCASPIHMSNTLQQFVCFRAAISPVCVFFYSEQKALQLHRLAYTATVTMEINKTQLNSNHIINRDQALRSSNVILRISILLSL